VINETNKIQLAQMPGKSTQAKINFVGLTPDSTIALRVNELGDTSNSCGSIGDEYNPLTEKDKLGRANPYQDPTRGRFTNVTVDAAGAVIDSMQKGILLNLSGYGSIMGRSIAIYNVDANGDLDANPTGCCVIGVDATPTATAPADDHHHHGHGYGHGGHGYGHGGYGGSYGRSSSYGGYGHGSHGSHGSHGHGHNFW
jgi:hypothetical protein